MDKNVKKIMVVIGVLGGTFLAALIAFLLCLSSLEKRKNSLYITYEDPSCQMAYNDSYAAYWEGNKIVIETHDGTRVSTFLPDEAGMAPNQIVLGEEGYYLLEWEDDTTTDIFFDATITQLDYESNIKKQVKKDNVAQLTCRDGNLFVGEWITDELAYPSFLQGFYANYYVEETQFGEMFNEIVPNEDGTASVDETVLYYHSEGYYSTEPELEGYLGTFSKRLETKDRMKKQKKIKKKRERMNFDLLLENVDWSLGEFCEIQEYQKGKSVFGICNFYDESIVTEGELPTWGNGTAVFYQIDCVKNQIDILGLRSGACAVLCTENYMIYLAEGGLVKEEISTGERENLLSLKEEDSIRIKFQSEIFEVSVPNDFFGGYWDQKDCEVVA